MHPRALLPVLLFLATAVVSRAVIISDPNILQYGVGKLKGYVQTGPGTVTFTDFTFQAFVDLRPGGTLTAATLQGPLLGGTQALTIHPDGAEYQSVKFSGEPTTAKGNLNGNFADSTPGNAGSNYTLDVTTVPGTSYSVSFGLSGDQYVGTTPTFTLDNGSWIGGLYHLNAAQTTNLGWNFSGYNSATDVVLLSIRPKEGGDRIVDLQFQGSQPSGYAFDGSQLLHGAHYVAQLSFARIVDSSTTIPGAQGLAFYAMETSFEFVAVPEPSTYVLVALGLGMIGLARWRRRRA